MSGNQEKECGAIGRQGFIRDKISERWASISRRPGHVLREKTIRLGNRHWVGYSGGRCCVPRLVAAAHVEDDKTDVPFLHFVEKEVAFRTRHAAGFGYDQERQIGALEQCIDNFYRVFGIRLDNHAREVIAQLPRDSPGDSGSSRSGAVFDRERIRGRRSKQCSKALHYIVRPAINIAIDVTVQVKLLPSDRIAMKKISYLIIDVVVPVSAATGRHNFNRAGIERHILWVDGLTA